MLYKKYGSFILIQTAYSDEVSHEHKIEVSMKTQFLNDAETNMQRACSDIQKALSEQKYVRIAGTDFSQDSVINVSYSIVTTSDLQFFEKSV